MYIPCEWLAEICELSHTFALKRLSILKNGRPGEPGGMVRCRTNNSRLRVRTSEIRPTAGDLMTDPHATRLDSPLFAKRKRAATTRRRGFRAAIME